MTKAKTCLGCCAYEETTQGVGYCALGYSVLPVKLVAGFYGKNKCLVGCKSAPKQNCPKPRTLKTYRALFAQKHGLKFA